MATRGNKGISTGTSLPLMEDSQHCALANYRKRPRTILPDLLSTARPTPELNRTLPFRERLGCSPSEACVALGVGRTFFYKLVADHRIEVTKVGRRTIVSVASLVKLLDGQR
jgi:excisionase family DNA binding protein